MNDNISYERRNVNDILDWLKEKAIELSEGRWTDFSSGDIGSVFLGLMAYLADMNNFQIDKAASELYLDTAVERSSMMSLLKLVGYEPRHYMSAYTTIYLTSSEDVTGYIIPKYSTFTNESGSIVYTALSDIPITKGLGWGVVYEGTRRTMTFQYDQITPEGRIFLPDYKLGVNTVELFISGIDSSSDGSIQRVEDVRFITGEFAFSVHVNEYAQVYIQLPSYWTDLITKTATIIVSYLLTNGEAGRIGANILTQPGSGLTLSNTYIITNPEKSEGGYFPETIEDLRLSAPRQARTMLTIVTKNDMSDLVVNLPEIADIKCGDYNDDWTGYVQPSAGPGGSINDAYKAKVLAVPANPNELSLFEDKYKWNLVATLHEEEQYEGSDGTTITYDSSTDELDPDLYVVDDSYKDSDGERLVYEYQLVARHQPTQTLENMVEYIDERRLASLYIEYLDAKRLVPDITLYLYTDPNDLRRSTIADDVKQFMRTVYDREYFTIGKPLYGSIVGRDLHLAFDALTYLEVNPPKFKIEVEEDEYIDMYYAKFKIYVNGELAVDDTADDSTDDEEEGTE